MYLRHFGLNEPPFTITPHTEFFFAGANRGATLEALIYAITHGEGIVKVSGEVGSGKTMLCRVLMERLPASVETIYLAIPSLNRDEMLAAICADLGVSATSQTANVLLKSLQEHLLRLHAEGRRVVALIDEAHAMPLDSLEEIRLLSNLETNTAKLLQIVLFGQPELDDNLAKPQMRQLRERITHSFRLSPLTLEDVGEYLRHRLRAAGYQGAEVFNRTCVKLIAKASQGLTRRINIIADKSLLAAYCGNAHGIGPAHIRAAIRDSEFASAIYRPASRLGWLLSAVLAAGLLAGALAAGWIMQRPSVAKSPLSFAPTAREEKPARSEASPAATSAAAVSAPTPPPVDTAVSNRASSPIASPPATSLAQRLSAAGPWLRQENPAHWVVQLMLANADDTTQLQNFITESENALGQGRVHVYPVTVSRTPKISVVYGAFPNRQTAIEALTALPPKIRQFKPYLRSIQLIRSEAEYSLSAQVAG